jgi:glycosyltransferase involved in cell wall biosynthesis
MMRIFHVVESLDRGAVENWLVNVFKESRKTHPDWEWTFYCMIDTPGKLDGTVEALRGRIVRSPVTVSDKLSFLRHLRRVLKEGRYDILHVHHDFLSGFYLVASMGIPFRKRILHVHNNDRHLPVGNLLIRRLLLPLCRWLSLRLVDEVLCISQFTMEDYKGSHRGGRPLFEVLYYGIDMAAYRDDVDKAVVKTSLDIPEAAPMLLFVGRMNREKNPLFALDVLSALLRRGIDAYLVLVGKGEKEEEVRDRASGLGLSDRIRIIGWSDRVSDFMKSADAFVFPRLEHPREGLGLVVVEAQCAGLPVFITPGIVKDAVELPELAHWNEPSDPEKWAGDIASLLSSGPPMPKPEAYRRMITSRFEISVATANLLRHYH